MLNKVLCVKDFEALNVEASEFLARQVQISDRSERLRTATRRRG